MVSSRINRKVLNMKLPMSLLGLSLLPCVLSAVAEEEYELLEKRPYVFTAEPNAFSGRPDCRSVTFAVDGAKLFAGVREFGRDAAIKVRARATSPETTAMEVTFHQDDGKVWGTASLPLREDWHDQLVPVVELPYFKHWHNLPPIREGETLDVRRLTSLRFCYGKWLCPNTLDKPHSFEVASVKVVRMKPGALGDGRNHSIDEFPREAGEHDDTERFVRAVRATPGGVLTVPRGTYLVSSPIFVANRCSFDLDKNAVLRATAPMNAVLELDGYMANRNEHDYGVFLRGGVIDGDGLASCLRVRGFAHVTLRDTTLLNGREYGLRVDGGYEAIVMNLYAKCVKSGMAGNVGFYVNGGDSHYTDCIVVDYTIGFRLAHGGSNRITRCHVWGGPLPPLHPGEDCEMLKDSVNFWIDGASSAILRDCYADTGKTGFLVDGWNTRLLGCSYYNNNHFKLDDITVIRHKRGRLLVTDGEFVKTMPHCKVYEGCGDVTWRNMLYSGFGLDDDCPGALASPKKPAPAKQPAPAKKPPEGKGVAQ